MNVKVPRTEGTDPWARGQPLAELTNAWTTRSSDGSTVSTGVIDAERSTSVGCLCHGGIGRRGNHDS